MPDHPKCPTCGVSMVLRTAKRGSNAGGQFWGCTGFPNCRGTRDVEEADHKAVDFDSVKSKGATSTATSRTTSMPRPAELSAKPYKQPATWPRPVQFDWRGMTTELRTSAACPRSVIRTMHDQLPILDHLAFSQYVQILHFTPKNVKHPDQTTLNLAQRLLGRGAVLPLPSCTEASIATMLGELPSNTSDSWAEAARYINRARKATSVPFINAHDSNEEQQFAEVVFPTAVGKRRSTWLLPQVFLGTLTGNRGDLAARQVVDFVFAHPDGTRIVIEIDGSQHDEDRARVVDEDRDQRLQDAGWTVIRIPTKEIRNGNGPNIKMLSDLASTNGSDDIDPAAVQHASWLRAGQLVQQAMWAVLELLIGNQVQVRPDNMPQQSVELRFPDGFFETYKQLSPDGLAEATSLGLQQLIDAITSARGLPRLIIPRLATAEPSDAVLAWGQNACDKDVAIGLFDLFLPFEPTRRLRRIDWDRGESPVSNHATADARGALEIIFGFSDFRDGQEQAIKRVLHRDDTILLLPTGGGKSITYQLGGLLLGGMTIVVDPILSLIDDQIENLRDNGIDRVASLTSQQTQAEQEDVLELLAAGHYLFCYIAPERLQSTAFRQALKSLTVHTPIPLAAIDEAHCVSEWGHDFRPAYLKLATTLKNYCSARPDESTALLALTGTASTTVLRDVQRELGVVSGDAVISPDSFDRPELRFEVIPAASTEKLDTLFGVLQKIGEDPTLSPVGEDSDAGLADRPGMVFCPWVNGKLGIAEVATWINSKLGIRCGLYSGKAPKSANEETWDKEKRQFASDFKRDRAPTMVCTKAFGMGIDKPNVRYTVHFALPTSIESFYQEAGRAGRDRDFSQCVVIYSLDYPDRAFELLSPSTDLEHVRKMTEGWNGRDDISNALWFHCNSFKGIESERTSLADVVRRLSPISKPREEAISFRDPAERLQIEKAIHRLSVLGVISDYTINYSDRVFDVLLSGARQHSVLQHLFEYVASYQRKRAIVILDQAKGISDQDHDRFAIEVGTLLLRFIYDIVERARRRALSEMLQLCQKSSTDSDVRRSIEEYLTRSPFTEQLTDMVGGETAGLNDAIAILESVATAAEASELRGECSRLLGDYADFPGLLLLRGMSELLASNGDMGIAVDNIAAAVLYSTERYQTETKEAVMALATASESVAASDPETAETILLRVLNQLPKGSGFARELLLSRQPCSTRVAAPAIVLGLLERTALIMEK